MTLRLLLCLLCLLGAASLAACSTFEKTPIGIGSGDDELKQSECASIAKTGCFDVPMDWQS